MLSWKGVLVSCRRSYYLGFVVVDGHLLRDCTIVNHHFSPPLWENIFGNVPFKPFSVANLVVDMLDHNGVFVQFFPQITKKMRLEDCGVHHKNLVTCENQP